jgi:hypothetical protein
MQRLLLQVEGELQLEQLDLQHSAVQRLSWHVCDELAIMVPIHDVDYVLPCSLLNGEALDLLHFPSSFHFSEGIVGVGPNKCRMKRVKKIKNRFFFESIFKISDPTDGISIFAIED